MYNIPFHLKLKRPNDFTAGLKRDHQLWPEADFWEWSSLVFLKYFCIKWYINKNNWGSLISLAVETLGQLKIFKILLNPIVNSENKTTAMYSFYRFERIYYEVMRGSFPVQVRLKACGWLLVQLEEMIGIYSFKDYDVREDLMF